MGSGVDGGHLSEVAAGVGVTGRRRQEWPKWGGCHGGGRLVSWMPWVVGKTRVESVAGVGSGS